MRGLMSAIAGAARSCPMPRARRPRMLAPGIALLVLAQLASPVAAAPFDPLPWSGNEAIGFYHPTALATDSHDNVHVADTRFFALTIVRKFTPDGTYLGPSARGASPEDLIADLAVD